MIDEWILSVVSSKAETEMLDMTYFAEYNSQQGFKIAVDGLHNTPNGIPFGVVISLNPNEETKRSDEIESKYLSANVNFATNIDWTSPNRSIKFLDGFYHFRDIPGQSN